MKVLDSGHRYVLHFLDATPGEVSWRNVLEFVKRCDPPDKYPGNTDAYPGTTNQEVCRALIDRLKYLDNQIPHWVNGVCISLIRGVIWLHEYRALRRKGKWGIPQIRDIENAPTCQNCGHLEKKVCQCN